jgi:hypothetical protein
VAELLDRRAVEVSIAHTVFRLRDRPVTVRASRPFMDEFGDDPPSYTRTDPGGPMPNVVVRYRTKPERAEENQQLVEDVFAELDRMNATGFAYVSFRLDDGVSFIHVVVEEEGPSSVSLTDVPAFRAFVADIADRCDEPPVALGATVVGSHRLLTPIGG